MTAKVVEFEINLSKDKKLKSQSTTSDLKMGIKGRFINSGNATVVHEYKAQKIIQQVIMIERVKSLSEASSVTIADKLKVKSEIGVILDDIGLGLSVSLGFSAGYTYSQNVSTTNASRYVSSEERKFEVTQRIEIPPCTTYEIDSFVKFTQNLPLQYAIYTELSGTLGGRQMLAEEIEKRLMDMVFVKKVDNFTILAKGKSIATVDFGVESFVNGQSLKLTECCKTFGI